MGLVERGSTTGVNGLLGLGFKENEAANSQFQPFTYPTILDHMVQQGLIKSRSYSIWLDNMWNRTGVILFGGIDTEKYTGRLIKLPIQKSPKTGNRDAMFIEWHGLVVNRGDKTHTTSTYDVSPPSSQPALLDTSSIRTYLPVEVANAVFAHIGADTKTRGFPTVPCNIAKDLTFTFKLGGKAGAEVWISIYELIKPLPSDKETCEFLIRESPSGIIVLGDSFLRNAYVSFDLDHREIAIAQSNFDATATKDGDKVVPITTGIPTNLVPSAGCITETSRLIMYIIGMTLLWLGM